MDCHDFISRLFLYSCSFGSAVAPLLALLAHYKKILRLHVLSLSAWVSSSCSNFLPQQKGMLRRCYWPWPRFWPPNWVGPWVLDNVCPQLLRWVRNREWISLHASTILYSRMWIFVGINTQKKFLIFQRRSIKNKTHYSVFCTLKLKTLLNPTIHSSVSSTKSLTHVPWKAILVMHLLTIWS